MSNPSARKRPREAEVAVGGPPAAPQAARLGRPPGGRLAAAAAAAASVAAARTSPFNHGHEAHEEDEGEDEEGEGEERQAMGDASAGEMPAGSRFRGHVGVYKSKFDDLVALQRRASTIKGLQQVRRQHLSNLMALLRQYSQQRNLHRLGSVAALLLQVQGPERVLKAGAGPGGGNVSEAQARLAEVLATGYYALRDGPWPSKPSGASGTQDSLAGTPSGPPTAEQLKRLLRQMHAYQPTAGAKDGVALELARLTLAQGSLSEAYDVLDTMPPRGDSGPLEADKALLTGLIRHAQWVQTMHRSEARRRGVGSRHGSSGSSSVLWPGFEAWAYDPSQWARAGREGRELFQEAGEHLQRAYSLRPGSTELAYLLAQRALVTEGGVAAAAQIALKHRQAAPADVDAHALHALLLVMGAESAVGTAGAGGGGQQAGALGVLVGCLEDMLRCDPGNRVALAAGLELHRSGALPASALLRLLGTFLDGLPPSLSPQPPQLEAWRLLSERVGEAAQRLISAHSAVQLTRRRLARHLRSQLAPTSQQAQQAQQQGGRARGRGSGAGGESPPSIQAGSQGSQGAAIAGGTFGTGGGATAGESFDEEGGEGEDLAAGDVEAMYWGLGPQAAELERAEAAWREVALCLQERLWWRQHHFVPPQLSGAVLALRTGRASAEALEAMSVVAAAVHGLWVQERLAAVSRRGEPLPPSLRSQFSRMAIRVLRQHGAAEAADRARKAFKSVTEALRIARGEERAPRFAVLGLLAHHGRLRADFWRAAKKPWVPPRAWLPVPLGLPHPQLGPVADLPPAWWTAFPQARRTAATGNAP